MVELLADMLIKLDKIDILVEEMREIKQEQVAMRQEFHAATERNTQAILSLTSLLQKTIIEPAQRQTEDIFDLKRRVTALEQTR